jgi:hypothetical protein
MSTEDYPTKPERPDGFFAPETPGGLPIARPQEEGELLRAKLLGETAKAPWHELQRFFAQGIVLQAQPGVDMLEVALALAEDNRDRFEEFLTAEQAGPVSDEQALAWIESDATLWTVVVKPWIVVQPLDG